MLTLSRKVGETIELKNVETGETILVMVSALTGSRARISIDAGRVWNIARGELVDREAVEAPSEERRSKLTA